MSTISADQYKMFLVCCVSKHFETMSPLSYIHPLRIYCLIINISQLMRRGDKLPSKEENVVSNNGLFPLVNDYSSLAFPVERKES